MRPRGFYFFGCLLCLSSYWACQQQTADNQTVVKAVSPTANTIKLTPPNEPHRPYFHFTPPEKWMNDPNGMVYFDGEYHLFYQHYPDSTVWGPMHWGHAVSRDLVTWEHLPIALYPDQLGYIFSGSAVIDWNNTSGFGKDGRPPMIAIFTHHEPVARKAGSEVFEYQSIAYSNDRGRSWTKYADNPVVANPGIRDFRDPKVIWDESSQQWVMIFAAHDHAKFYGSPDLKNWTPLSEFGRDYGTHAGVWECPDFFPMPVEGTDETRWVILQSINPGGPNQGSATQYFVGNWDGKNFTLDADFRKMFDRDSTIWLEYGRDNYAGVTWSDVPKDDGRRIFMGWMSNWTYAQRVPTDTWRSAMTVARRLSLHRTPDGYRLRSNPVRELQGLRKSTIPIAAPGGQPMRVVEGSKIIGAAEVAFNIPENATTKVYLELSNGKGERYRVGYDAANRQFFSDRTAAGKTDFNPRFANTIHTAPRFTDNTTIRLHVLFDVASAELFADDGRTVMTDIFFPTEDFNQLSVHAENGSVEWVSGTYYPFVE